MGHANPNKVSYNPEQRRVVEHEVGPVLVNAVAGSGKTAAICGRIGRLVTVGVRPARILAVTFSRDAAKEMNERIEKILGPRSGARVGTFHSLALEILRTELPEYANWEISDAKHRMLVKQAVGWQEMEWKEADVTVIEGFISRCMCDLAMPGSDRAAELATALYQQRRKPDSIPSKLMQAYERVEELRKEKCILTFDAMLAEAVLLLQRDPTARARWQSRYDHVVADEGQDSNLAQITLAEILADVHRNYMAVGDEYQRIYSWRGAVAEQFRVFPQRWPGAEIVDMTRNYRCGSTVIDLANKILAGMGSKLTMLAERGVEGVVTCTRFADFDGEANAITTRVIAEKADGRPLRDFAVLYRTAAQSRALEEAFLAARIPYVIRKGCNFYERAEVSDLLAYLRIAVGRGDSSDVSRCINKPFRFLGKAFLGRIESAAETRTPGTTWSALVSKIATDDKGLQSRQRASALGWCDLVDEVARRVAAWNPDTELNGQGVDGTPAALLELVTTRTGYTDWLRKEEGDETTENSRVSNVRELIRVAAKFRSVREFLGFVDETVAKAREAAQKNESVDAVTLSTLHSSKGLEWPVVFLIGANEGILPHARAEDQSEEMRLFYVGVTRARDELHLSCIRTAVVGGKVRPLAPSPYLTVGELTIEDPSARPDVDTNPAEAS